MQRLHGCGWEQRHRQIPHHRFNIDVIWCLPIAARGTSTTVRRMNIIARGDKFKMQTPSHRYCTQQQ